ncbi:MAG: polysaccharide deacetylase family protein [Lachnospiraceae bacterium]
MSDKVINVTEENRRRRRINKIKKIIICLVIVCITVPTALSGMLMVKIVMLEKEIEQLKEASAKTLTAVNDQIGQSNVTDLVVNEEAKDQDLYEIEDVDQAAKNAELVDVLEDDKKKVYLTFDDGPSENTDQILDILAQYNIKATFFVVAKDDEESIRRYNRIVNEGHTLAMHSYTHVYNQIYASMDAYRQDVYSLQNFLQEVTGVKPTIYRFPGGSSNTVMNIDVQECLQFLQDEQITYFDWNVSSGDATGNGYPASTLADNVINGIEKNDVAVVLMHDARTKDATVASLPGIIERLQEMENVEILPLTEDSYPVQHTRLQ